MPPDELDYDAIRRALGIEETPAQAMKRIEGEMRGTANAQRVLGGGYSGNVRLERGPLSAMAMTNSEPTAGQPTMAGGRVGVGPLGYAHIQPMGAPKPVRQVDVSVPFDADAYFGVNAASTPSGRQYGVDVGKGGFSAYGQYTPNNRNVSAGFGYRTEFAEGGPVYDPMGGLAMPGVDEGVESPTYNRIANAIGDAGAAVGKPIVNIARGAADIPGTVADYLARKAAGPDPSQAIGEDIRTFGGHFIQHAAEHPIETALDLTPIIGEIRSGMDAKKYETQAAEAEAVGDFDKAKALRQMAAVAAAGAAPLVGIPARLAKRGAKTAEELARVSHDVNALSKEADAAKLAEEAPKIEEASAIAKEAEVPHNPDTVGAEARADQPITGGNEDLQFTALEREKREKGFARITAAEREQIEAMAREAKVDPKKAVEAVREKRKQYPTSDGWAPFEVVGFEKDAKGGVKLNDEGLPELKVKQEAYQFHQKAGEERPIKEGKWDQAHVDDLADKLANEVTEVANRADKGDKNASVIMAARNWYAAMRNRLRQEYGGFADVMADVLGTTSAQTNVRQNWENTIEVLSQFSRGAYDRALGKLQKWIDEGGEMGSAGTKDGNGYINGHLRDLKEAMPDARKQAEAEGLKGKAAEDRAKEIAFQKAQEGEFPLITKADGKTLFNANSPQTMMALLDEFRKRKTGDAPKTPNFTGNLIGYSDKATIDVWAARLLRRLSGRDRLIPDAESGVGGAYLASPLESGINVGGEFGFGQEVFQKAAEKLRQDPRFKNLGDDDLQAIAWFLEKEQWGKKGYTTKSGEGGSLELEANFAGVSDRDALKEQRRLAETDPTFGERQNIKKELADPKTKMERETANAFLEENGWILDYKTPAQRRDAVIEREGLDKAAAAERAEELYKETRAAQNVEKKIATKENRLATLEERSQSVPAAARASLDEMQAIARRFTGGLSPDRPNAPAMPEMFVEGNKAIIDPLKKDPEVMMMKATPSQGRYIDPQGNIWDEPAYDLEFVTRQNFDPHPTFENMVREAKKRDQESTFLSEVVEPGSVEGANPGVEVYFTKKLGPDVVDRLTQTINQLGVDAGFTFVTDFRAKNRAAGGENVGEYVGIRVQYIPEFGGGVEGIEAARKQMYDALDAITAFDGVSSARYVEYDTQVLFKDQYDAYLAGSLSGDRQASWARQPRREGNQATDGSAGVLKRATGGAVVYRGRSGPADAGGQEGQAGVTQNVMSEIAESGLDRRQIATLLRMASTGTLAPDKAMEFADSILTGNIADLDRRFQQYPRSMRILSRVDAAVGGEAALAYGDAANRNPNGPLAYDGAAGEGYAKGGTVRGVRRGSANVMKEVREYALTEFGAPTIKGMEDRAGGDPAKFIFALNQYTKNLAAQDPQAYSDMYKQQIAAMNEIARKYNINLRTAFRRDPGIPQTVNKLDEAMGAAKTPAFKQALERMHQILGG